MNTKTKKRGFGGFGIYILLILLIVLIWYVMTEANQPTSITKAEFEKALELGTVKAVKIVQNREVPTGNVTVLFTDETQKLMYVSDTNEIQTLMESYEFTNYYCEDVPRESWLMKLLPYLLMFGAFFILFVIMQNNAAAQSGGSKI